VIGSVSIAERGSEIDAFGGDVLLIAVLPVEVENVFDGPEVAGFVWGSGCIFDVVERELVFSGSCDSCAGVGAGALEALVTVAMCVFLTTERLDAGGVEGSTSDSRRTASRFWSVTASASVASGSVLSSPILSSNRTSIVACMGYLGLDTRGNPAFTGVSYY